MRQIVLRNWNFARWIRLVLGVAIIIQAATMRDVWFAFIGLILSALALFNIGCCGTGACYVPAKKEMKEHDDIAYEEIK